MSRLALVLAGGGGKGAYQIGVWKALREFGIDQNINAVSGTSVGALNAITFLQGDYDLAERIWLNISHDQFLKNDIKKVVGIIAEFVGTSINKSILKNLLKSRTSNGIFSREGLLQIIDQYINLNIVSTSHIKCYITCCHTPAYRPSYFNTSGESADRIKLMLLASSALPYI